MSRKQWQPWMDVEAAENTYFAKRADMFAAGGTQQLLLAMANPSGAPMAMRILKDLPCDKTMELFEPVFARATSTHGYVSLARELLSRLDAGWLFHALRPVIKRRLESPEADWEDYRRIAEVLRELDQHAHLADLVVRAEQSSDTDILEVAEDFRHTP